MTPGAAGPSHRPTIPRYTGKWRGIVMQVNEQLDHYSENRQQRGRIKVCVPAITGVNALLAWALPAFPFAAGAALDPSRAGDEHGAFWVPGIGSQVWVEFEQGDVRKPIWTGCFYPVHGPTTVGIPKAARGEDDGTERVPDLAGTKTYAVGADGLGSDFVASQLPEFATEPDATGTDFAPTYPYNFVWKTPSGHTVEVDDTKGAARIRIRHRTGSQIQFRHNGDVKIFAARELHLVSPVRVIVKAPEVKTGGGDLMGNVLTDLTQPLCQVTGLPMGASRSVKANS